jgi:hypothetical protein
MFVLGLAHAVYQGGVCMKHLRRWRNWTLVGAFVIGSATAAQSETSAFDNIIAARGGCINIHTIRLSASFFRYRLLAEGTGISVLGKPVLKWSDDDIADTLRVYKDCWNKVISSSPSMKDLSRSETAEFEQNLRRMINDARAIVSQRAAREKAEVELKKAKAESEREAAEEETRRKQAQLSDQARADREAAEEARQLAEREAPNVAEAAKEADEARRLRQAAEQKLAEIRSQLDAQIRARDTALAQSQGAEIARQRESERQAALKEDEELTRPCKIRLSQFNQAQLGMHQRVIARLFGCKGTQVSATQYGGSVVETYSWQGNTQPSSVTATFEDALLKSKMQFGLE